MKTIKPKLIEFNWGNYYHPHFTSISVTPSLQICRDNQLNETYKCIIDDELILGYTMYSIIFEWLGFYFEIQLNKLTKNETKRT
jgi:hypothetical protein